MDKRIVMTLDAGGTNMVFSAIQDKKEIVPGFPARPPGRRAASQED